MTGQPQTVTGETVVPQRGGPQRHSSMPHASDLCFAVYSTEGQAFATSLNDNMAFYWWRPGMSSVLAPGLGFRGFIWWLMHVFHIFGNREYSVLFITYSGRIIHRTCLIPRYFRWPFMGKDDLQISTTWTELSYRGQNLATLALQRIVTDKRCPNRKIWYISRVGNLASISVAEKAGFGFHSYGKKIMRFGLYLFGYLQLVHANTAAAPGISPENPTHVAPLPERGEL